jgi:hypothetical protein
VSSVRFNEILSQLKNRLNRPRFSSKEFMLLEHLVVSMPSVLIVICQENKPPLYTVLDQEFEVVTKAYRIRDHLDPLCDEIEELYHKVKAENCLVQHELEFDAQLLVGKIYKTELTRLAGFTLIPAQKTCIGFFWTEKQKELWCDKSFLDEAKDFITKAFEEIQSADPPLGFEQLELSDDPSVYERFLEAALYGFKLFMEGEMSALGVQLKNRCEQFKFSWLRRYTNIEGGTDKYGYFLTRDQIHLLKDHYLHGAEQKIKNIQLSRYQLGIGFSPYVGATRLIEYTEDWRKDFRVDTPTYPEALREVEEEFLGNVLFQLPLIIRGRVEFVLMIASESSISSYLWTIGSRLYEYRPVIERSMELEDANKKIVELETRSARRIGASISLGTVVHVIRNELDPLNRNLIEFERTHEQLRINPDFQSLKRSVKDLIETAESSLAIAREQRERLGEDPQELQSVSLKTLAQEAWERMDPVGTGIRFVNDINEDLVIIARADYIRIMFQQFFGNSVRAIQDKKDSGLPYDGIVEISGQENTATNIRISLKDDGYGRLATGEFNPALGSQSRLMLGLYIADKVLKLHWGCGSCISSTPERGTEIVLELPLILPRQRNN